MGHHLTHQKLLLQPLPLLWQPLLHQTGPGTPLSALLQLLPWRPAAECQEVGINYSSTLRSSCSSQQACRPEAAQSGRP